MGLLKSFTSLLWLYCQNSKTSSLPLEDCTSFLTSMLTPKSIRAKARGTRVEHRDAVWCSGQACVKQLTILKGSNLIFVR